MANEVVELGHLTENMFGNGKGYGVPNLNDITDGTSITAWPKGHIALDEQGAIALPVVGAASADILWFIVPIGYDGFITSMSNVFLGGSFDPAASDIVWRLLADYRPIRNFQRIIAEKGSLQTPRPIEGIRIYAGQRISLEVEHVSNVSLSGTTAGSVSGYFYPSKGN